MKRCLRTSVTAAAGPLLAATIAAATVLAVVLAVAGRTP